MGLPISKINIALRTASASRAGFGTPMFIASHKAYFSRTQVFTGVDGAADSFSTSHAAYKAVQGMYSNTPSVDKMIVGRRDCPSVTLTPEAASAGKVYSVKVTLEDASTVTAQFVATGSESATDIVTDILADLTSLTDISLSGTTTVDIADDTQKCTVTEITGFTELYTSTETATDALTAIREENDDFYFVMAEDHTETFVLALAAAVQSLEKLYFVSLETTGDLSAAYSAAGTSIAAQLVTLNYNRTVMVWDRSADDVYSEANFVGVNAPYSPDRRAVVWDGRELAGVALATNTSGNALTTTQQINLESYNYNFTVNTSLGVRIIGGKTVNGTWIDEMRIRDCITARVREALDTLILNQAGSKLVGGARGVALCKGAVEKALTPFIGSNALSSFTVFIDNATIDPVTRTVSGIEFEAVLQGAILRAVVDGTLVNEEV